MLGIFAFTGAAGAAATLMVSPSTGLTNGQSVTVTATGFTASATGAILECNNDASQPTILVLGVEQIPVSCSNPLLSLQTTDSSGNVTTSFTVSTGTVGPPASGTDSSGGSAATDAANYPCPPTAAQISAGDSCVIAFGVEGGSQQTQPITFSGQATTTTTSGGSTTTTGGGSTTTTASSTTTTASTTTTTTASTTTTTTAGTTTTTVPCNAKSTTSTASGPSMTANPGTCLNGGSVVTVTGSGFDNSSAGALLECNNDSGQPTVALVLGTIKETLPVSCSAPTTAGLITTSSSGGLSGKITIIAGTVGPPCGKTGDLFATCPATDSAGGSLATDAAKYPCPPTSAQTSAGDSCVIAFGDSGSKQQTVNISFVPAPTPGTGQGATAPVTQASNSGTPAATAGSTTATTTPSTSASTLAFTGAGPGMWFTLLGGLLLLDLGYLMITVFYRPREFAQRLGRTVRTMFGGN